jgi:hypothetical protein
MKRNVAAGPTIRGCPTRSGTAVFMETLRMPFFLRTVATVAAEVCLRMSSVDWSVMVMVQPASTAQVAAGLDRPLRGSIWWTYRSNGCGHTLFPNVPDYLLGGALVRCSDAAAARCRNDEYVFPRNFEVAFSR